MVQVRIIVTGVGQFGIEDYKGLLTITAERSFLTIPKQDIEVITQAQGSETRVDLYTSPSIDVMAFHRRLLAQGWKEDQISYHTLRE